MCRICWRKHYGGGTVTGGTVTVLLEKTHPDYAIAAKEEAIRREKRKFGMTRNITQGQFMPDWIKSVMIGVAGIDHSMRLKAIHETPAHVFLERALVRDWNPET